MNCKRCGNIIYPGEQICRYCGTPVVQNNYTQNQVQPNNQMNMNNSYTQNQAQPNNQVNMNNSYTQNQAQPNNQVNMNNNYNQPNTNGYYNQNIVGTSYQNPTRENTQPNYGQSNINNFNQNNTLNNNLGQSTNNYTQVKVEPNNSYENPVTSQISETETTYNTNNNKKKKKNKLIITILGIISILLIIIMILTVPKKSSNTSNATNNKKTNTNTSNNKTVNDSVYKYGGFEFQQVKGYHYFESDGVLKLASDTTSDNIISIKITELKYDTLKLSYKNLQTTLSKHNLEAMDPQVRTISNTEFITCAIIEEADSMIYYVTKANDNLIFEGMTVNETKTLNEYKDLEMVANIIKTAKYVGTDTKYSTTYGDNLSLYNDNGN